jgi:hypothetical protein
MRPIGWLHISDFHLRVNYAWAQDAVLSAMRDDIIRRRKAGAIFDFVLATGDIAYAGKAPEYKLAVAFFDELAAATAVPREKIFCIPGNHDIDRDRQKMSFAGARLKLQCENDGFCARPNLAATISGTPSGRLNARTNCLHSAKVANDTSPPKLPGIGHGMMKASDERSGIAPTAPRNSDRSIMFDSFASMNGNRTGTQHPAPSTNDDE